MKNYKLQAPLATSCKQPRCKSRWRILRSPGSSCRGQCGLRWVWGALHGSSDIYHLVFTSTIYLRLTPSILSIGTNSSTSSAVSNFAGLCLWPWWRNSIISSGMVWLWIGLLIKNLGLAYFSDPPVWKVHIWTHPCGLGRCRVSKIQAGGIEPEREKNSTKAFSSGQLHLLATWLPNSTDFHDFLYAFVSFITNIKAANIKQNQQGNLLPPDPSPQWSVCRS